MSSVSNKFEAFLSFDSHLSPGHNNIAFITSFHLHKFVDLHYVLLMCTFDVTAHSLEN
mgnify:FL=1